MVALSGCQLPEQNGPAPHEAGTAFFHPASNTPPLPRPVAATVIADRPQVMAMSAMAVAPLTASSKGAVTLAWDHSPDTNVIGYRIYYGPRSGNYTNSVSVGYVTEATLTELVAGSEYFFAATAYNATGDESVFSNETSYTPAESQVVLSMDVYVFRVRWACVPLKTNILQVSTNLPVWFDTPGRYYRTNVETIMVLATNSTPHAFYRVRIQQ